jgi:hypothetical protein
MGTIVDIVLAGSDGCRIDRYCRGINGESMRPKAMVSMEADDWKRWVR